MAKTSTSRIPKPERSISPPLPLKTIRDIAMEDQVSEKTVRRAIDTGLLKVIRVGPGKRLIRIHPEAHAAYHRTLNE